MKSKTFNKWLKLSKYPQGNYQRWQIDEFVRFAKRAWKAGQAAVKERVKQHKGE